MSPLSISKSWEETTAFLARESRLVAPIALALVAIPATVQAWIDPAKEGGSSGFVGLILMIVSMAGQLAIAQLAIGWRGSIGEAIGKAFRRLWAVIGAGIAIYGPLVLLAVFMLGASLGMDGIARLETMSPEELVRVKGVAVTLLLVAVLGIFLSVRFLPMIGVAMGEDAGVSAIIRRSWALTRGHFGKLFLVILLLGLASILLSTAIMTVVGTLVALAVGPLEPLSLSALITGLLNGLLAALVSAVYSALVGRIYVNLADRGAPAA
ncbi:hypothetical protein [Sphingomonas jaspsi]|uniref:hypothetical protein n=1 Tax=Sphingomonas jaspsi TaxID=392409 RepID=UPI0004BBC302|nr:hypothetical protein [Sphingomonas jaspsi]